MITTSRHEMHVAWVPRSLEMHILSIFGKPDGLGVRLRTQFLECRRPFSLHLWSERKHRYAARAVGTEVHRSRFEPDGHHLDQRCRRADGRAKGLPHDFDLARTFSSLRSLVEGFPAEKSWSKGRSEGFVDTDFMRL